MWSWNTAYFHPRIIYNRWMIPLVLFEHFIRICHDDIIKWKHFPRYWPFVRGILGSPLNSPHKGQWRGPLMFSLIYARTHCWVNNRKAGDLIRHLAHYDITVMTTYFTSNIVLIQNMVNHCSKLIICCSKGFIQDVLMLHIFTLYFHS